MHLPFFIFLMGMLAVFATYGICQYVESQKVKAEVSYQEQAKVSVRALAPVPHEREPLVCITEQQLSESVNFSRSNPVTRIRSPTLGKSRSDIYCRLNLKSSIFIRIRSPTTRF